MGEWVLAGIAMGAGLLILVISILADPAKGRRRRRRRINGAWHR